SARTCNPLPAATPKNTTFTQTITRCVASLQRRNRSGNYWIMSPSRSATASAARIGPGMVLAEVDHKTAGGIYGQALASIVIARCATSERGKRLKGDEASATF